MRSKTKLRMNLPAALVARLEKAAQADGLTPSELVEKLLDEWEQERSWQGFLQRGQKRGAALLPADADEEAVNDLVNAKMAEARRERAR